MEYFSNSFFLIALTFATYFLGKLLRRWTGWVIMNPILVAICCMILFLKVTGISYETYSEGGRDVELSPKDIHIESIDILRYDDASKQLTIKVNCGKGTYIRALARDLGKALGSGAYLTALRRTRVGDIKVSDCIALDAFESWLDKQEYNI